MSLPEEQNKPETYTNKSKKIRYDLAKIRASEPPRILLVDDDSATQESLAYVLRKEGYKVAVASNGEEGLHLLDEFSPDVLCIDYMMPGMDGQELARRIRDRHDLLYIPIVMLTAAGNIESIRLASLNSGVDAYLNKPISKEELKVTIVSMLRIKAAQDKMLEALDKVAEVQDELLLYEREKSQLEAIQGIIAAFTGELTQPLKVAMMAVDKLTGLVEQDTEISFESKTSKEIYLKIIKDALGKAQSALLRLSEEKQVH
ncbi:MAG: response regulator [Chloroflexi bacterium]|uniref:Response regulator n=1 Tax=Candidatus Chlorohelix allophototropha TaxID=3003348 RepID=A0A8T7M6Y6_9CHLR|nr:response regulator [Chloroflexota bacterium]WJW69688.1 response regulator [Chloroflexota bacterium L227-S17]